MFPYSGLTQTFGALVFLYLAYRFFRIYQIEKYSIAKFFSYTFFIFSLIYFILGIPSLFFIEDQAVWSMVVIFTLALQVLGGATLGYIFFYIKFPRISPKWGFFLVLIIEMVLIAPSLINPPVYFFEPNGVLNWEVEPLSSILRCLGILFFTIPIGMLYLGEAKKAKKRQIKIRAYGLGLGFLGFTITYFLDFILLGIFRIDPKWSDILLGSGFLILLLMILFSPQIMRRQRWVKFVE